MTIRGTEGYAEVAAATLRKVETIEFADINRAVLHLIPETPAHVLDVGACSGRDAAGYAKLGHSVVAVEPVAEFREAAQRLHPSARIEWIDDHLPDLATLRGRKFDFIQLQAVWMHLDAVERARAMRRLSALLRRDGLLILTLRHGPVPKGKRMFDVDADETESLAAAHDLRSVLRLENQPSALPRADVIWTRLAFAKRAAS